MNSKKITILCQHFYPEEIGTGLIVTELAEDLTAYGYEVSVIAGRPSPFYCVANSRLNKRFMHKHITVRRVCNTMLDKKYFIFRLCNALTYSMAAFLKLFTTSKESMLLVYTSPPFLPLVGFSNKILRCQKYVIILQDVFPDTAAVVGYLKHLNFITMFLSFIYKASYSFSDKLVVIGRDIKLTMEKRGIRYSKMVYLSNWADGNLIKPLQKDQNPLVKKLDLQDKFIIGYSGTMGMLHSFDGIVKAALYFRKSPIIFLFITNGLRLKNLKYEVEKHSLKNFLFLPFQEKDALKYTFALADAWLVTLRSGFEGISVPGKLYSYMASGRAIIATVPYGSEVAKTVEEAQCGFVVSPNHSDELTDAINTLFKDRELSCKMGRQARLALEARYNRQLITRQYKDLFDRMMLDKRCGV